MDLWHSTGEECWVKHAREVDVVIYQNVTLHEACEIGILALLLPSILHTVLCLLFMEPWTSEICNCHIDIDYRHHFNVAEVNKVYLSCS